jgi:hypothetical protein
LKQGCLSNVNPKAFSLDGKNVVVLCGGQSIRFFEAETGKVKHEIQSTKGGRWNEFAITPQGPCSLRASQWLADLPGRWHARGDDW